MGWWDGHHQDMMSWEDMAVSANGANAVNGAVNGANGVNGHGSSNGSNSSGQMFEEAGFNAFVPYYDQSLANGSYSELNGQLPPSAEPEVQWWAQEFDERAQSKGTYNLRSVGSMRQEECRKIQFCSGIRTCLS